MRAPAKGTAFFLALLLLPVPAAAEGLALYKAVYALKLVAAAPGSAVTGAGGEMYYEQDDACDGWTTEQRLATRYDYAGGRSALDTARYAAFESKDGGDFSFNAEQEENGREDMHISGSVARGKNGAATALYTRPDGARRALPA
ncbi:MAG: DUF1849 family protein, partial [Alphaproteobacteria bacterium]|nr:DUF1849 family protein [Alphaproteobacteria bacterium]